jgi:hypothetical protein
MGPAAPEGSPVQLGSLNPIASVPASVVVPAGQTTATFTVTTSGVTAPTYAIITASMNGQLQQTLTLNIAKLIGLSFDPPTTSGLSPGHGIVTLDGPAGPSGAMAYLTTDSKLISIPATVSIPSGQVTGTFLATPVSVTKKQTATVTALMLGVTEKATLTMVPDGIATVTVNPDKVNGGQLVTGTVTLTGIAPKGGVSVHLTSSKPAAASVLGVVMVPAGSISQTFSIKTKGVASETVVTITGKVGTTTAEATLTVEPPVLLSVSVNPTTVGGGATATGTATLSGSAPTGGLAIELSSNNGAAVVPVKVTILTGKSSGTFTVKTGGVTSQTAAKITGSLNGNSESCTLTIKPVGLAALTFSPARVAGGGTSTGTLTLNGPAPAGGLVVSLSGGASYALAPQSVTIAAGKSSGTFKVKTTKVNVTSAATVTATMGSASVSGTLTVTH